MKGTKATEPGVSRREGSISRLVWNEWFNTGTQFVKWIRNQYVPSALSIYLSPRDGGFAFEHPWKELVILYKDAARWSIPALGRSLSQFDCQANQFTLVRNPRISR